MNQYKILALVSITLLAKTILDPIIEILANHPGVTAFLLLLGAALLAFTCFTAGLLFTHLKFARISSRK